MKITIKENYDVVRKLEKYNKTQEQREREKELRKLSNEELSKRIRDYIRY